MINHILPIFSVYFCENKKIYDKRRIYTFNMFSFSIHKKKNDNVFLQSVHITLVLLNVPSLFFWNTNFPSRKSSGLSELSMLFVCLDSSCHLTALQRRLMQIGRNCGYIGNSFCACVKCVIFHSSKMNIQKRKNSLSLIHLFCNIFIDGDNDANYYLRSVPWVPVCVCVVPVCLCGCVRSAEHASQL